MFLQKFKKLYVATSVALALASGNAMAANDKTDYIDLEKLQSLDSSYISEAQELLNSENTTTLLKGIEQMGLSIGAQHGYAAKVEEQMAYINKLSDSFDRQFDFKLIMLSATKGEAELYLLPPVVSINKNVISVSEDNKTIRITEEDITIVRDEQLVIAAPNWREYVQLNNNIKTKRPHPSMLPKTAEEKAVWSDAVKRGWEAGSRQADHELNFRLEQLGMDFNGMVRYMRLVKEGKMEDSIIAKVHRDVVGGGDNMRINDTVYRLTSKSKLISSVKFWKPLNLDTRSSLRYDSEFE